MCVFISLLSELNRFSVALIDSYSVGVATLKLVLLFLLCLAGGGRVDGGILDVAVRR